MSWQGAISRMLTSGKVQRQRGGAPPLACLRSQRRLLSRPTLPPPAPTAPADSRTPPPHPAPARSDFERVDRERALELLLSQERVISLLYDKTFPPSRATSAHQTPMSPSTAMSRATRTAPSRGSTAVSNDALDAHMSQLQSH